MKRSPSARLHAATFRFYAELNDFLPTDAVAGREMVYRFEGTPSIKDAIEAQGVPHTEVELILVEGRPVGFSHRLHNGERVAVYPVFESIDVRPVVRLREAPLRRPRFVVDANLGRLARWLRLLGFDSLYRNDLADAEIVTLSVRERRVVLTRDRLLLHHKTVTHGYWLRSDQPEEQAVEVLHRFQLERDVQPLTRCLACNGVIHAVAKSEVADRLEPLTRAHYDEFFRCSDCGRIYWRGSHHARLLARLRRVLGEVGHTEEGTRDASRYSHFP